MSSRLTRAAVLAGLLALAAPALAQQGRFEPNQTRRTASRLEPGDFKGLFCDGEDWYAIDVPAGRRLEVSARFTHADGDLELEVHEARGRLRAWSRGTADEEVLAVAPSGAETLFLRVHNASNAYDLHVGLGDGARGGAINCWGSDWYPLAVAQGEELRATVELDHSKGDLDVKLYDPSGDELAASTGREDREELRWTADEEREVLVNVFHVHRSRADYRLSLGTGAAQPDDLAQVFRLDRPEGAGRDVLELRTGELLQGTVLNERFRLATPYADVEVPAGLVAGLDLERKGEEVERLVTVHDDRLSGFLRTDRIRFRLEGFDDPVSIARERIVTVVFGRRGSERRARPPAQHFVLRSGDQFVGRLLPGDGWTVDMGFAVVPVVPDDLHSISFEGDGMVTLLRRDQTSVRGRFDGERLEVELLLGGEEPAQRIHLHPDRLSSLRLVPGADQGLLDQAQLRNLLRQLAPDAPRELVRDLVDGTNVKARLEQLRALVRPAEAGSLELERHVLAVEDLEVRYAWFELLLRVDRALRDRLVRLLSQAHEPGPIREAAAFALVDFASSGGGFAPLEAAVGDPAAAELIMQAAMARNDQQLMQWVMNRLRSWRGGQRKEVDASAKQELMEALPRLIEDK